MKLRNSNYLTHKGTSASVLPIKVPMHMQYLANKVFFPQISLGAPSLIVKHWQGEELSTISVVRVYQYGRVVANLTNKEMAGAWVGSSFFAFQQRLAISQSHSTVES